MVGVHLASVPSSATCTFGASGCIFDAKNTKKKMQTDVQPEGFTPLHHRCIPLHSMQKRRWSRPPLRADASLMQRTKVTVHPRLYIFDVKKKMEEGGTQCTWSHPSLRATNGAKKMRKGPTLLVKKMYVKRVCAPAVSSTSACKAAY